MQLAAARDPALVRVNRAAAPVREAPGAGADGVPDGRSPIGTVAWRQRVSIEGQVELVQAGTAMGRSLEVHVFDDTGGLRLLFYGRTAIPGLVPGARVRASGRVGEFKGHLALANPRYELLAPAGP
jgi:RecG-like helicase